MAKRLLTKQQIVEAAYQMLNERTSSECSMRALGARLGVSAMTLYSYVKDRDELFGYVYEMFITQVDTDPIPGEAWDDTLRRITMSYATLVATNMRQSSLDRKPAAAQAKVDFGKRVAKVLLDQGMPNELVSKVLNMVVSLSVGAGLRSFSSHITNEIALVEQPASPEEEAVRNSYSEDALVLGTEAIINHIKAISPEPCTWRTPL